MVLTSQRPLIVRRTKMHVLHSSGKLMKYVTFYVRTISGRQTISERRGTYCKTLIYRESQIIAFQMIARSKF